MVNGDAESGPGVPRTSATLYIPGWATHSPSCVAPNGGTAWITGSSPGLPDRGVNLFCGGIIYQDIDVANAAKQIDAGQVKFEMPAWLGSLGGANPTLSYSFFDWADKQLAPTALLGLGPVSHSGIGIVPVANTGALPAGTRRVHIDVSFPNNSSLADDISLVLTASGPPTIGAVVSASAFGGFTAFAPGSWIEIYGSSLASNTRSWTGADIVNGNAPTSLDGVSVSIGGVAAFLDYISPGQLVALVPSTAPTGASVTVTVTNSNGTSASFSLPVNPTEPGLLAPGSFKIGGNQYVAALFSDGQTFVLPQGAISGVASRPARPGETITLYGVGFGPVSGAFMAGTLVTGPNTLDTPLQFQFGSTPAANPSYDGLAPSAFGLYHFNVVVPNVGASSAMPLSFDLGGTTGSQKLFIAVQN